MADAQLDSEPTLYRPSRGLQTILSVTFFLIMLFMVNALAGALWLATHNLQGDSAIFLFMFVTGSVMLLYAGIFLFAASHSEVHLGPDKAVMVLPNWRGPTPFFPYTECEVPYKDLASVETRGEIYRYLVLPVIVQSACLVRKDGKRLTLGYVRENPEDPSMPFHTIAEQIARRAGVPLVHKGIVEGNSGLRALIQDEPGWDAPQLAPERLEVLRKAERFRWTALMGALAVAMVAAVAFQASRLLG
ncbi:MULTISPECIES: hypothetical protein [Rhodomicrobium]|uniref:hypothetical protein n=1 Tax=Rhodomicrobium TaxID=1068 RepID=UPI000B4B0F7D|nr:MULTISPECIES: hypothetical protein [Rhodomicrobium]